jgi:hypothetical protein
MLTSYKLKEQASLPPEFRIWLKRERLGAMTHTYNSSYSEGRDEEDSGLRPSQAKM